MSGVQSVVTSNAARRVDRGVAAEVDERCAVAVFGEQVVAVGVEEPDARAGFAGDRVADLLERKLGDTLLHHGTQCVGDVGVREDGAQPVERADDGLGQHRRRAATLGAGLHCVVADDGHPRQCRRVQWQQPVVVAE